MFLNQNGAVVTSPSDLAVASACEFSWLRQLDEKLGRIPRLERVTDPMLARAGSLGDVHEARILDDYRARYTHVVEIPRTHASDPEAVATATQLTREAFDTGADVIFQATFADDDDGGLPFIGFADFIVRTDTGYRVQDAKLARRARVTALLQLAAYAGHIRALGVPINPEVDLLLGDGSVSTHNLADIEPIYRLRRQHLATLVHGHLREPGAVDWEDDRYSRCGACDDCTAEIEKNRDMWQVYNLRGVQRTKLRATGLRTIDDIAAWTEEEDTGGVPNRTMKKLARQAKLQCDSEGKELPTFTIVNEEALAALPAPNEGDIFFDFEGDPMWTPDGHTWGIDYLFGLIDVDGNFTAFWAHTMEEEKQALLDFLDFVEERLRRYPDLHIYHYASYERSHLSSIALRHGVGEDRVDHLLRSNVLVDLYAVVGKALQIGIPSYSIKQVEALHMAGEQREGVTTAADSVGQYAIYVEQRDAGETEAAKQTLQDIADYNEYDCISTLKLRDWLLTLMREYEIEQVLPVESPKEESSSTWKEKHAQVKDEVEQLESIMLTKAGDRFSPERTSEERAWGLVGAALRFHEREDKIFWWDHYARRRDPIEEWAEQRNIFHIENTDIDRDWFLPTPRSRKLRRELTVKGGWTEGSTPDSTGYLLYEIPGPDSGDSDGLTMRAATKTSLSSHSESSLTLTEELQAGISGHEDLPIAFVAGSAIGTDGLRKSIRDWASSFITHEHLPEDPLGDLLMRRPSRLTGERELPVVDGDSAVPAVVESLLALDNSYLAVQGPPGTGKTYVAANTIIELVRDHDWKIGVVAQSHKVINNVLSKVAEFGLDPARIAKAESSQKAKSAEYVDAIKKELDIGQVMGNGELEDFVDNCHGGAVIGGTAWAFSRLPADSLDLVVIDEAGQYSLANTIASGKCAKRLLLVGDPQQLPQVSSATHPEPVDESALGYLSEGHDVLPAEFGYFLAESRRMDKAVTRPVSDLSYEGRLHSHPVAATRSLAGVEPGLVPVAVDHDGNITASKEEADVVVSLVREHLGARWCDGGEKKALEQKNFIVVTPYNAQVETVTAALQKAGLGDVPVGTVDKFQGQEAVIAIMTLAASSSADAARGLSFLLSRNRLNVGLSRAQWKAFLVYSPGLLNHLPTSPDGLRELSAFARLVDNEVSS